MTRTVNILKVLPRHVKVRGEWRTKFDIFTSYRAPLHSGTVETFDPFAAETCRQAAATGRSVVVTSYTTSWGEELTACELTTARVTQGAA